MVRGTLYAVLALANIAGSAARTHAAPAPSGAPRATPPKRSPAPETTPAPRVILPAQPGLLVAEIAELSGNGLEVIVNGTVVAAGDRVVLDTRHSLEVRAVVVGPRRRQSRELRASKRRTVTVEPGASDVAFAYRTDKATSRWNVLDERYDWTFAPTSDQVIEQTLDSSRAGVLEDRLTFVFSSLTTGETLDLAIAGAAQWGMAGTRADGSPASDRSEDAARGTIVIRVSPRQ